MEGILMPYKSMVSIKSYERNTTWTECHFWCVFYGVQCKGETNLENVVDFSLLLALILSIGTARTTQYHLINQ
jgi:hypothetical protein